MKRPRAAPLYLARDGYRRRRLMDAARMLPVAAAVMIALPVLWAPAEGAERDTAANTVYLFALWLVLIAVAFVLSRGLSRGPQAEAAGPAEGRAPATAPAADSRPGPGGASATAPGPVSAPPGPAGGAPTGHGDDAAAAPHGAPRPDGGAAP